MKGLVVCLMCLAIAGAELTAVTEEQELQDFESGFRDLDVNNVSKAMCCIDWSTSLMAFSCFRFCFVSACWLLLLFLLALLVVLVVVVLAWLCRWYCCCPCCLCYAIIAVVSCRCCVFGVVAIAIVAAVLLPVLPLSLVCLVNIFIVFEPFIRLFPGVCFICADRGLGGHVLICLLCDLMARRMECWLWKRFISICNRLHLALLRWSAHVS